MLRAGRIGLGLSLNDCFKMAHSNNDIVCDLSLEKMETFEKMRGNYLDHLSM